MPQCFPKTSIQGKSQLWGPRWSISLVSGGLVWWLEKTVQQSCLPFWIFFTDTVSELNIEDGAEVDNTGMTLYSSVTVYPQANRAACMVHRSKLVSLNQCILICYDMLCFLRMALLQRKVPKIVAVFGTNRELAEASSCYVKADHEWCGRNIWWFSIYLIAVESLRKQIARTLTFAMATSYSCPWRTRPVLLQLHILNSFTCWTESLPISNLRTKKKIKAEPKQVSNDLLDKFGYVAENPGEYLIYNQARHVARSHSLAITINHIYIDFF